MGIIEKAPIIRHDLALHYTYGSIIYIVSYVVYVSVLLGMSVLGNTVPIIAAILIASAAALLTTAVFAYAKERYSKNTGRGTYDMKDFRYTVYGALPAFMTSITNVVYIYLV